MSLLNTHHALKIHSPTFTYIYYYYIYFFLFKPPSVQLQVVSAVQVSSLRAYTGVDTQVTTAKQAVAISYNRKGKYSPATSASHANAKGTPLGSEMGWTGELWEKTNLIK